MILGVVISILTGITFIVLGVVYTTGNINSLHSYHRENIKEEDKKPFGKRIGAGMIVQGIALLAYGVLLLISELASLPSLTSIGLAVLIVGIILGLIITFWAIKKYNKTIF
ncbi:MAG: hypothetical protein E7602_07065 [Ruminococcaceae bacterium]|nr:hypothetical protein [Oscillospiraceae bacterium]